MPFFMLLNSNNLNVVNVSDQFLYTMITFLGKENAFLDVDVKNMLSEFVETTFTSQEPLDFESKLSGRSILWLLLIRLAAACAIMSIYRRFNL